MRRFLSYMLVAVLITITGCVTSKEIIQKSKSERTDVFSEVKEDEIIPKGFADLVIKASIKTHLESYYILESKESLHGKPGYPFVINIDGQAAVWKVDGQREVTPAYDEKGKRTHEGGEGMRYILEKRIRLSAGSHKVFLRLPDENYFKEFNITFKEGEVYVLEFKPIYKYKTRPYRIPTFLKGIKAYKVFLNGYRVYDDKTIERLEFIKPSVLN